MITVLGSAYPPAGAAGPSLSQPQPTPDVKFMFRSFPDMKPDKLLKGASLKQIQTFAKTFSHYMIQGFPGGEIPQGAVYPVLLLSLDESWHMSLEDKGLKEQSTINEVETMLR